MKNLKNFQEQSSVALWLVMVLIIVLKEKVQAQVDVQPERFVQEENVFLIQVLVAEVEVETLVDHHIPVSAHGEHLFRTNLVLARRITVYRVSYILMKIIINTLNEYLYKMSDVKKRLYSLS
jgi:hypothetical protein